MWQVIHNPDIMATIHLVEFSTVEIDAELDAEYGCPDFYLATESL